MGVRRPFVSKSRITIHHLIVGTLDGVHHDHRLIDHGVMYDLIKQLLELHGVIRDCDMMWRGESTFLNDLPISADEAERLEASSLEAIDGLGHLLLLEVVEILFGDVDDVAGVGFISITFLIIIISGRFYFDCVDVVVNVGVVDVDDVSHWMCQEAC